MHGADLDQNRNGQRRYDGHFPGDQDQFNGPSFFGEAKEVGSLRPIQNVQVKAELGEQRISTYTSNEGSFKIPGFGPDIAVDSVAITWFDCWN